MRQHRLRTSVSPHIWVAACTFAIGVGLGPATRATTTTPSGSAPASIASHSDPPLEQYRALRRMHAENDKMDHRGWVDAWTEFDSGGFRYQIVAERGSDTIRNKVLKTLLKREQELIANGDFGRGEVTAENYEFGPEIPGPDGVRYVALKPRRRDVMLIDGRMVLSASGEMLRVEGLLSKNPSFWTTEVNVTRRYARVDGVRVPVSTESLAKVRFVGNSRLNVTYEYETINHRTVKTGVPSATAGTSLASGR